MDPRSWITSDDRYADPSIDPCNLLIRTAIEEKAEILLFVDLRPSRPRVFTRPGWLRYRSHCDHVRAIRDDTLRGRCSIQFLHGISTVSLSRIEMTRWPEKAEGHYEHNNEEFYGRPADRCLVRVWHFHLDLGHLEDREERMRVHFVILVVDLIAEILQHRRTFLLKDKIAWLRDDRINVISCTFIHKYIRHSADFKWMLMLQKF